MIRQIDPDLGSHFRNGEHGMIRTAICSVCMAHKRWPDAFPHRGYVVCAECYPAWEQRRL